MRKPMKRPAIVIDVAVDSYFKVIHELFHINMAWVIK